MKAGLSELSAGRPFRRVCNGNSMAPGIKEGDVQTIVPHDGSRQLKEHDVVLVRLGAKMLTHQILRIEGEAPRLFTIANARGKIDGVVTEDAILGIVVPTNVNDDTIILIKEADN